MLALRKTAPEPGVTLMDVPEPAAPNPGEALLEVLAAGVCGSDLHIESWAPGYRHLAKVLPITLGHEFVARVVEAPGDPTLKPGTRVVVVPATFCGKCEACTREDFDGCRDRRGIGVMRDGGFARYACVPARNCLPIPVSLPDDVAVLTEPMAVGANAVAEARIEKGMRVVVFGPGTIGQGISLFARRAGADVTVVGRNDGERIGVLRSLGFTTLYDTANPFDEAALATQVESFDVAFEAAGSASALSAALAALRPRGRLIAVGIQHALVELDMVRLVRKRLNLIGAFSSPAAVWPSVLAALAETPATFAPLVTHRFNLADIAQAFAVGHARKASKAIVLPWG